VSCPSFETLLRAIEEAIEEAVEEAPEPTGAVADHLASGCTACERRWRALRATVAALEAGPFPAVSPAARRAAVAVARVPGPVGRAAQGLAELVFDSFGASPRLAVRRIASENRHILYVVRGYALDLLHTAEGTLVGQLAAPDGAEEDVRLDDFVCVLHGPDRSDFAALDGAGEFQIHGVPRGRYALLLESPQQTLVIDDLDLTLSAEPRGREGGGQ